MPELKPRVVVMVPTYDERDNVGPLADAVLALGVPGLELVFVDDESPDGTAARVAELSAANPAVRLLSRRPPAGRGLAGRDGYLYALERGADFIIEMDGDLSHPPRHIPELLAAMSDADIAVGSRLVAGGSDRDRPFHRRRLTLSANAYARVLLGLPVADVNSGYRCFSRRALEALSPSTLTSEGPSILHETLHRAVRAGLRLREVPIEFVERKAGASKLGLRQLVAGWLAILKLRLT